MTRAGADALITNVDVPSFAQPGDEVDVDVTIENLNTEAAPGESFDLAWVRVWSPDLTPTDVILECTLLAPGGTHTADGCSSVISPSQCSDGEFSHPGGEVDLNIEVGGFPETDPATNCSNAPFVGTTTDSQSVTITESPVDQVVPTLTNLADIGGILEASFDLTNQSSTEVNAGVALEANQSTRVTRRYVLSGGQSISDVIEWNPGLGAGDSQEYNACITVTDVQVASAPARGGGLSFSSPQRITEKTRGILGRPA